MKKIYLTTSIPYINAEIHIGHSLEFVQADFFARFLSLFGKEIFLATGSDENSLKVVKAAQKNNLSPQEFTKRQVGKIKAILKKLEIDYNHFQRTSSQNHSLAVKEIFQRIKKEVYEKEYQGFYCPECEAYLKKESLKKGKCPVHKIKPVFLKEKNLFFPLSKYQEKLKEIYLRKKIEIIPHSRTEEVISFLNQGLEDISISRDKKRAENWGIEVPGRKDQIFYVWFDALINYLSNLGFPRKTKNYLNFWQNKDRKVIHFIGKDILKFHAILWPAVLLSARIPLPNKVFVHGFLLSEGEKMSKSKGNFVRPEEVIERFKQADVLRYFLLREFSPFEDGDFSWQRIEERYNSDLRNGLGNLVSRIITLFLREGRTILPKKMKLLSQYQKARNNYYSFGNQFFFQRAIDSLFSFIKEVDVYINKEKPWQKDINQKRKEEIFSTLWLSLAKIAFLTYPIMPKVSQQILYALGFNKKIKLEELRIIDRKNSYQKKFKIRKIPHLFPKI